MDDIILQKFCINYSINYMEISTRKKTVFENGKLISLDLSHTKPEIKDNFSFNEFVNLQFLDLSSTGITELPTECFRDLTELDTLILNKNPKLEIVEGVFDTLHKLIHLSLEIFKIKDHDNVSRRIFESLKKLKIIELKTNFPIASDLFQNRNFYNVSLILKSIPRNAFTGSQIRDLYISGLNSLTSGSLTELGVKHLFINDSRIKVLENNLFGSIPSLELLDLSSNNIRRIEENVFNDLPNLKELHLSNNNLTSFPDNLLDYLYNLNRLYISGNHLDRLFIKGLEIKF